LLRRLVSAWRYFRASSSSLSRHISLVFTRLHFSSPMRFSNRDALARLSYGIWSSALNRDRDRERIAVGQPHGLLIFCTEFSERWTAESLRKKETNSEGDKQQRTEIAVTKDECGSINHSHTRALQYRSQIIPSPTLIRKLSRCAIPVAAESLLRE